MAFDPLNQKSTDKSSYELIKGERDTEQKYFHMFNPVTLTFDKPIHKTLGNLLVHTDHPMIFEVSVINSNIFSGNRFHIYYPVTLTFDPLSPKQKGSSTQADQPSY